MVRCCCLMLGLVLAALIAAAEETPVKGLSIAKNGVVLKDGKPYRGIGINYFDALSRSLTDPADTSYREGLAVLAEHDIPFIRMMACGFWPNDWKLYFDDKDAYFARFDVFVKTAEELGIGLIPSLFWYYATVPDLVGEPMRAWGDPSSKTIAFMRQYVSEVVPRYAASPAIWAWELGNEYNLGADLPNAADHRPHIVPHWGSPTTRSEADDLTHDMVATACREFAKAVRQYDKTHPVTTGHSIPRPAAEHMRAELSWKHDTRDEFQKNLLDATPDPADLISIHVYPDARQRFDTDTISYEELMTLSNEAAIRAGKALFVGEFGASDAVKEGGPEAAKQTNLDILKAIESSGIPLAAHWVFDLGGQGDTYSVTATNDRAYVLDALEETNRRLQESGGK